MSRSPAGVAFCIVRSLCCVSSLALAACATPAIGASPAYADDQQSKHDFNIPAAALEQSIMSYSQQAQIQVVARASDLQGLRGKAVAGSFTAVEALRRLLGDAPVAVEWVNPSTVALSARPAGRAAPGRAVRPVADQVAAAGAAVASVDEQDIVVTARKREENPIATPVILSAVRAEDLNKRSITALIEVAQIVPQLVIGNSQSVQGGSISLRGIGSSESNPFADQAVSFSVDGIQIARATVQRMAQMDLAQIAVYKGPQALFFGKNSPAGVVDIKTADPTSSFVSRVSLGYGFNGKELKGDGFVSGPLTDTLGARLTVYGSRLGGYSRNIVPDDPSYGEVRRTVPYDREHAGRLTLKFQPSADFSARFKLGYNKLRTEGPAENQQLINCPKGFGALSPLDNCRPDTTMARPNLGPKFAVIDPRYGDGVPFLTQEQWLASLEANYKLSDALALSSTTGYYFAQTKYRDTLNGSTVASSLLANYQEFRDREFSQELRLTTSWDGPANFVFGGYYQHINLHDVFIAASNANAPAVVANFNNAATQTSEAWSGFAQTIINFTQQLELAGGARYSYERKNLAGEVFYLPVTTAVPTRSFKNVSPEATLTYRPSPDFTLFGAYKEGFLSGGFNVSAVDLTANRSYDPQTIRGFEVGAKAALLDRTLRLNVAAYSYQMRGLQVQSQVGITQVVTNAGKAKIQGAEFDFRWQTPLNGLSLNGALSYNDAHYQVFTAPCYAGQTPLLGCSLNPNASGVFRAQDLAGRPLVRAPEVVANGGFDYEASIGETLVFGLNGNASRTSKYFTNPSDQPASLQRAYWLLDAGIKVGADDHSWHLDLIGRNLTNRYYITRANDVTFTGSGTGTPAGVRADVSAVPSRGREVMLRLTMDIGAVRGH